MLTPIVCPSCGLSLCDVGTIYCRIVHKRNESGEFSTEDHQQLLKALRLKNCCTMHLITTERLSQYI